MTTYQASTLTTAATIGAATVTDMDDVLVSVHAGSDLCIAGDIESIEAWASGILFACRQAMDAVASLPDGYVGPFDVEPF